MWLIYLLIFGLGLIVGSFLNCVIYRLDKDNLLGRSYCPHCKHQLNWKDLIPLVSFLSLKGECRYCGEKISWRYPLVELSTALLFVLVFYRVFSEFGFSFSVLQLLVTGYLLLVTGLLLVVFVYDLKHFIIPNSVVITLLLVIGSWYLIGLSLGYYSTVQLIGRLGAGLGAALPFLLIVLISRGKWMGMGDVKLILVMGLFLGWPRIVVGLFFSFVIGGIIGMVLITSGKKRWKSKIPLGPLLVVGTFIAWGWGQQILTWYLNYFNV